MAWTTPTDRTTGYVVSAADWNIVEDNLTYLYARPQFQVHLANAQTLTTAVSTKITYDTIDIDNSSGWSAVNHQYTIPTGEGGMWTFSTAIGFASNATGNRGLLLSLSLATNNLWQWLSAAVDNSGRMNNSVTVRMAAGAVIEVDAIQSSGGNLNTLTGIGTVEFAGVRVG